MKKIKVVEDILMDEFKGGKKLNYSSLPKTCITFFAYSTVVKQENTAEKSEQ